MGSFASFAGFAPQNIHVYNGEKIRRAGIAYFAFSFTGEVNRWQNWQNWQNQAQMCFRPPGKTKPCW